MVYSRFYYRSDNIMSDIDYDKKYEENFEKLNKWLDKCPFEWQEVMHPSSGMTTINVIVMKDEI
jgi:hypothetical protein